MSTQNNLYTRDLLKTPEFLTDESRVNVGPYYNYRKQNIPAPHCDSTPTVIGATAYSIAVINGFVGTEQEWLASLQGIQGIQGEQGEEGLSAYEVAVASGFRGNIEEWLLSLKVDSIEWTSTNW